MLEEINEFDFENRIVSNEYDSMQDAEVENDLRPKNGFASVIPYILIAVVLALAIVVAMNI